jgi:mannan endo-1,4-beta-mannosidase
MKIRRYVFVQAIFILAATSLFGQNETIKPATPHASPEAKALLQLLYNFSGNHTLMGQHNFPMAGDRNSRFAANYIGKPPVIWSMDFGFAKEGDKDSYRMRSATVEEAERQNKLGSIITLCWHAVPPTANEPVTFQPVPGADPAALASVQGRLTDDQFKDILTPGTALYNHWAAQVDTIAFYLKQLQKAHVPVLWRPYHEMNGNWFWWGNRLGQYSTQALYRQLFDRLVNYHKLTNLVWVWSVDRPTKPGMEFSNFYPGNNYLDIVALDVYGSDFKQDYYDQLLTLSNGKPITLAEVGSPPSPEVLESQPKWSYWVVWAGMVRNTSKKQYEALVNDTRVLGRDDPAYINAANALRTGIGQPLLPLDQPADFSGEWALNEDKSTLGNAGAGNLPARLTISQDNAALKMQKTYIEEWQENRVTDEKLGLNGEEGKSTYLGFPRTSTAGMSANRDTLTISSKVLFNRGGQTSQLITTEVWSLQNHGKELAIVQTSDSPQGKRKIVLIYDKQ